MYTMDSNTALNIFIFMYTYISETTHKRLTKQTTGSIDFNMSTNLYMSVCLYVCMSLCIHVCLKTCVCLSVCLSTRLQEYMQSAAMLHDSVSIFESGVIWIHRISRALPGHPCVRVCRSLILSLPLSLSLSPSPSLSLSLPLSLSRSPFVRMYI